MNIKSIDAYHVKVKKMLLPKVLVIAKEFFLRVVRIIFMKVVFSYQVIASHFL